VISPLVYGSMKQYRIIYNGVADFWLDHVGILQQKNRRRQVIYIGDFSENKNLKGTVKALQKLQEKDITFVAIGGEKEEFLRASGLSELPSWIKVIARTCDKNVLLRYLSESRVFVMPSYRETFGLVYLEALSQGCCVVHSKDEGIDGIFDEAFICRVDPEDFGEISDRIGYLVDSYPKGTPPHKIRSILIPFSWSFIAKEYMNFIDCS
jgi:glycosyltransferase involved in cell wall biosynthesis